MKGYHKGRLYDGEKRVFLTICMESLMFCVYIFHLPTFV